MSPLVVSELLPADQAFFDVVIFDEASQIISTLKLRSDARSLPESSWMIFED